MSEFDLDETTQRPQLRVDLLTPVVHVVVGRPATVILEVHNTSSVIEQVDVRLLGLMAEQVAQTPSSLTLFPEETIRVTLDLTFHDTLPAGSHDGLIVAAGGSGATMPAEIPLTVEVPRRAQIDLRAEPPVRSGGRRGTFELLIENTGNTHLDLLLQATDADRVLDLSLSDRKVDLRVDQTAYAVLITHGRRPWTGSPTEHVITIAAEGDGVEEATEVHFRQKAKLTAGVITILTLLLIVTLWTLAMLFGVRAALSPPEPTKSVPETFMQGTGIDDLDPATSGGGVAGVITAASTGQPLERVTVEAFDARGELVTATASDDDGAYELTGLLPARYRLRLRATGYEEQWWPGSSTASAADELMVTANEDADAGDSELTGLPGGLGGQAVAGDGDPVEINVAVSAIDLTEDEPPVLVSTDEQGFWSVDGLTAPATYRITYTADGFAPVEFSQAIAGGEELALDTLQLPAATGAISGRVEDRDGTPIGGVELLARNGDTELATTTPTSGEIGSFTFGDLETPGTYLVTVVADGFASETQGVQLGPGESVSDLVIVLSDATGTVRGRATATDGTPLGGVTVTVSGGGAVLTTDTLTSGQVGTFRLSDVPLPGVYTVSFDRDGYERATVQVALDAETPEVEANGTLAPSVGRLSGRVVDAVGGDPLTGVEIEVSDGSEVRGTTTASAPQAQAGRFSVGDLAPGSYTVTATTPDGDTLTVLETVRAAETTEVTLQMGGS